MPIYSMRHCTDVDLTNVRLDHADLRGCCLMNANLCGASLKGAQFDPNTVLPNGEPWTPEDDISRFTDADHADFVPVITPPSSPIQSGGDGA